MKLSDIARACKLKLHGASDPEITEIVYDSRSVIPGALFFCLRGKKNDGHHFIERQPSVWKRVHACQMECRH